MTANEIEFLCEQFQGYIFKQYANRRHIRRVVGWLPFMVYGIDKLANSKLQRRYVRQASFQYQGQFYYIKFDHTIGSRGGFQFFENTARGRPGTLVFELCSLDDARRFYDNPASFFPVATAQAA
jgi:hypothetical protein